MKIVAISLANLLQAQKEWERKKMGNSNCCNILDSIVSCKKHRTVGSAVRALEHNGRVQGAVAYTTRDGSINIDYLSSAPWNVYDGSKDKQKFNGCGAKLVMHVYKRAAANSRIKYIELWSQHDAIGFYKKLGFRELQGGMRITRREIAKQLGK